MTSATPSTPSACWRSSSTGASASSASSRSSSGSWPSSLHGSPAQLDAAQPWIAIQRRLTAPAARRYVVGWAGERELHVLSPRLLAQRASNVEGSLEMLMLAPSALLARHALARRHPGFPPPLGPLRMRRWMRGAWFVEGGAQWLSGQTRHVRPAVARRLREGGAPAFPPKPADALLLGGTVFDLLAREEGERAAVAAARPAPTTCWPTASTAAACAARRTPGART